MRICHACRQEISLENKIGRRDVCPSCKADLRCCLNCSFHDRAASKQCREPVADQVREKEKANFCDYFTFDARKTAATPGANAEEARRALDSLFRK